MARERLDRSELEARLAASSGPLDLSGADLSGADLSKLDLRGACLDGALLRDADLSETTLCRASLREATLDGACLERADLLGADAREASFPSCRASGASFGGARLDGCTFFEASLGGATLSHASLRDADLRCARLEEARLHEVDLCGADLSRADLAGAELDRSQVAGSSFDAAILRSARVAGVEGFERASFLGADLRDMDLRGAFRLRRHIIDENYLHEFRSGGRGNELLYQLWWLSSDCGRSFWRWAAWTALIVVLFAIGFEFVELDLGDHPTPLSTFYYSVVTLTTLGYGDVLPASPAAQLLAMLEVVVGYIALGGLISIFANKMARRGE